MARQRRTGGGGCLAELVVVTLLVWPIGLMQPVCGWSDSETGGLEVAACGLLAIAASVRGRGRERTARETPNQDAVGLRAIVAPRVAMDRSLVPSRRSNGPWADHASNLGPLFAPGRIDRRHRKDAAARTNSDGPTGGRRTRRAPIRARMRFDILQRDGFRCRYCGRPGSAPGMVLHVDHVVPLAAGGTSTEDNLLTACEECNLGKSTMALLQSERGVRGSRTTVLESSSLADQHTQLGRGERRAGQRGTVVAGIH
jgi:5-methylcytosine-specific restriction endonuclease McrA